MQNTYGQVSLTVTSGVTWKRDFLTEVLSASADEFVQVLSLARPDATPTSLVHPTGVRAILPLSLTELGEPYLITGTGDIIRVYDVASLEDPELIQEIDAHWHDVTAIQLWDRKYTGEDGKQRREPWIISTSLDGTLRKWRLPGRLLLSFAPTCQFGMNVHIQTYWSQNP